MFPGWRGNRPFRKFRNFGSLPQRLAVGSFSLLLCWQAAAADIKIEFVPPPMEGTISLGIYDVAGKRVRTLHHEADTDEFKVALNGLVTHWDGKDDAGAPCPPGQYHARGYSVGDLKLDGIGFHGNDWVTDDDSPHLSRIHRIAAQADGTLLIEASVPGETGLKLFVAAPAPEEKAPETEEKAAEPADPSSTHADAAHPEWKLRPAPEETRFPEPAAGVRDGALFGFAGKAPKLSRLVDATPGSDGALWVIDGEAIKELSATGEVKRMIPAIPDAPAPEKLTYAAASETLFVLSGNKAQQQLRALRPATPEETIFEKSIHFTDRFEDALPLILAEAGTPFVPESPLKVSLVPNPLLRGGKGMAQLRVEVDAGGAVLTTLDGLPLTRVSETPHLKWAVIGRAGAEKAGKSREARIFESDGAVVAEFEARRLDNMMAFDAGVFELKAEPGQPQPAPAEQAPGADPTATSAPGTPDVSAPTPQPEAAVSPAAPAPSAVRERPEATATPEPAATPKPGTP